MRKTPSYVKGLAETRARAAGDGKRFRRLAGEIASQLERVEADRAACDRLIRKFDDRLDPAGIPHQGGEGPLWDAG